MTFPFSHCLKNPSLALGLTVLLLQPASAKALAPKDIASQDSILSQGISGDEAAAPYMLNGESLVGMLQDVIETEIPGSSIVFNRKTGQIFVKTIPSSHGLVGQVLDFETRREGD